jgi:lysosomal-trafficking regulator
VKATKYFNFSLKIRSSPKSPTHQSHQLKSPKSPNDPMTQSSDSNSSTKTMKTSLKRVKVRKLEELSDGEFKKISKAFVESKNKKKEFKTPTKVHLRRLKPTPKKSPFKKVEKVFRNIESEFSEDDQLLAETFKSLMSPENRLTAVTIPDVDIKRYEDGVSILQENLFIMLRDIVLFLDDQRVETDLHEFMNIEMLIMFANHNDPNTRTALIELIQMFMTRLSNETISKYEKQNLWFHLGNQLSMHPVDSRMVQACMNWIFCEKMSIQQILRLQKYNFNYKPAIGLLVAMIPAMIHDCELFISTTKFLIFIYDKQPEVFTQTNLNHLIASLTKALIKTERVNMNVKEAVIITLEQIATRALISSNSLQILWDLLYALTFIERNKKIEIIREVHLMILRQLLSSCLVENHGRRASWNGSFFITQTLGNLQSSDIKTRFNTILERAIHFTMTWNIEEKLSTLEIDFVTFLIELIFSGFHQNSSIILWSLSPQIDEKIRNFTIEKILKNLNSNIQIPGNDLKLVRSLLMEFLNSNPTHLSEESLKMLSNFCGTSLSQQQQSWSWSRTAIDKIESLHDSSLMDQILSAEKIVYRYETHVQAIIDGAMKMTRNVVDRQNKERRALMNDLKQTQEIDFYREWHELIQRMIHEDAPWYNEDLYPSTWELDETEGPNRIRIRLKRSVLNIEERFFNEEFQHKSLYCRRRQLLEYLIKPNETERYSIRDRIVYTFNGKHLTLEQEIDGEIIITDLQLIFLANRDTYTNSIICDLKSIQEVWNRRYQHKKISLEFFLECRKTFFIIFESNYERDIVKKFVEERLIDKKKNDDFTVKKWIDGRLTNFEYLIELNTRAGRSYNDLMQYPVFPWILNNYESEELDLKNPQNYRKFNKTISTQHEDLEQHYITNYNYLAQSIHEQPSSIMRPYHYSSHYSNSGTILHFLVRLPPFTNMFLNYQDHNFDIPDRTFHSMATTFRLTSKESATDVKELIPEFFYLFDFLENSEGFDFGKRQSGEAVNDVKLPQWCENNSRLFMLIHRQALESEVVRKSLNQWIDLIFGIKQRGNAAIDAINVFHPAVSKFEFSIFFIALYMRILNVSLYFHRHILIFK